MDNTLSICACSFCHKPNRKVVTMIKSNGIAAICDECIAMCNEILSDAKCTSKDWIGSLGKAIGGMSAEIAAMSVETK